MVEPGYNYLNNTNARMELLGVPNIFSPFAQFDSASRVSMYNHHLDQTMVLDNPDFPKTFTGMENSLIDYTFNRSRREHDMEIIALIPKYDATILPMTSDDCPLYYVIGLTLEDGVTPKLDYFEVNRYFMGSQKFGFIPTIENRGRIRPGEVLDKNTIINRSPTIVGDRYCMGRMLNVIYGSFPETIEDAFIISKSAAEKLQTTEVAQTVINCRQDRRPLNLYGDNFTPKLLPDIGSYVNEHGELVAFRPAHWTTAVADADPELLKHVLPAQDDCYYISPGSKIIDLTFNINLRKMNNCYPQARLYMQSNNVCWTSIYETYLKYRGKYKMTPKMSTLVKTAIYRMIAQDCKHKVLSAELGKIPRNLDIEGQGRQIVDFLQIIVTHTKPRYVKDGDKLTDQHGAKGVVGKIYPDEWMPVDDYGNRAEMWIDMNSPVARNNPGQLFESGINRISLFAQKKMAEVLKTSGSDSAFEVLMDWYGDVNPNYEKLVRETKVTSQQKAALVKESVENGIYIWIPPFLSTLTPDKDNFWNAVDNIMSWQKKWEAWSTPVTYSTLQADGTGKEFRTIGDFAIGPKYILHLHKLPEQFAPGPAAVNHIGVPTKSPFESKSFPVSNNPYRFGEDESRMILMDSDARELFRLQCLASNSPTGVNLAIRSILLSDNPTQIKRMSISNGDLAKTNAILRLTHSITAALGVQTKSTRNDELTSKLRKIVAEDNELEEAFYRTDIIDETRKAIDWSEEGDDDGFESITSGSPRKKERKKMSLSSLDD